MASHESSSDSSSELHQLHEQKRKIEKQLKALESQIYALEGTYLEETHQIGNIARGWDGFLAARPSGPKRMKFRETDRLFSMSSVTSPYAENAQDPAERRLPANMRRQGPGRPRKLQTDEEDFSV
jgi:chromatin modification-related protein EAF6